MNMLETLGPELVDRYSRTLQAMANDCRDDPEFRARVDAEPRAAFADRGLPLPRHSEVRVVRNTENVFYMAIPPDPNTTLSDAALEQAAGGGSASCISTLPSCIGTFGCATNA